MSAELSPPKFLACFSCNGPDSESLLKSGYFQQLLNFDEINDTILNVCEYKTTSFSAFNNMRQTFMKIKQKFQLVKGIATRNFDCFRKDADVDVLRMDILKIFYVYLVNLQKSNSRHHGHAYDFSNFPNENSHLKNTVMQLASEIKHLLVYIGRVSSIPDINTVTDLSSDTSKRAFNYYHYYHLCLDIWFNCLIILCTIHFSIPIDFKETFCDFTEHSSAILQVASFLVHDLSFLLINRYMNSHLQKDSPFICSCMKELWIILIKICDNSNLHSNEQMFWNIFLSNLKIILKKTSQVADFPIDKFSASNFNATTLDYYKLIESCFWLTSHVTQLCKYSVFGHISEFGKANSGSDVGKYLIHSLLNLEISEKCLRGCLLYCIELSKLWEANAEIMSPLIDFYIRNIDKTFSLQESYSYLFKDAKSWFVYIESLSSDITLSNKTSFDYFLSILSLQLRLDKDNCLWRSLKGRIYSKIIPKKVKELSEIGLQNTFSLFQAIVISGQLEIATKIYEVASIIETLSNPRKQMISWKALFVLLYINSTKKHDSGKAAELLSKFFNSACTDYSKISCDSVFKNNLMNLLLVYIDSMDELFKRTDGFSLSTYHLISSGFTSLLKSCSLSDQNYILRVILNILQNILLVTESNTMDYVVSNTECVRTLQLMFDNIYPLIKTIAVMETVPPVVPSVAVIFTNLTFAFSSTLSSSEFNYCKIFMFFACKDNINSIVTCNYLSLLFNYPQIIEEITSKLTDFDILVLQAWLKCLINIQMKNDDLRELTKKVLNLPVINEIIPGFEIGFNTENTINMVCKFFSALGNYFTPHQVQNIPEKIKRKLQSFFKNYASVAENKIHRGKDTATFSHVYKLTSLLVESCSLVLHRVSPESILLQILDKTIYPQILFPRDKTLQNLASCAIKEHLPHFLRGLFKLDFRRDKAIERQIRSIFIYYIGIFPISNNPHPLVKLFIDSFSQKPNALDLGACLSVLEILKSSLLSNVENPESIFRFYQEIFLQTPPTHKKDVANVILKCAMEIFMGRTDSTEFLKGQIKKVLSYYKDKAMLSQAKVVLEPVIKWFIEEKLQWAIDRGFTILDIFVDYVPQVMVDYVGFLKKSIEYHERNRGFGEDEQLRSGFQKIIARLQLKFSQS